MPITAQQATLRLLSYKGITQFAAQPVGSELVDCTDVDIDEALVALNGAMQEIHAHQPIENMERAAGAYLHAPTQVTLTATNGSQVISALTTFTGMQLGSTIRVAGDDQDNELVSNTRLARPYLGTTGSAKAATVYGDCINLPREYSRAVGPVTLPNQLAMPIVDTMDEFLRIAGWPTVVGGDGRTMSMPFYYFIRKTVSRPVVVLGQGGWDSALSTIPRRLRFAPMPDAAYAVGFRAVMNPVRFTRADVVSQLTSLTVSGAGDGVINGDYDYLADVAGYRMFRNAADLQSSLYYHPGLGKYILCDSLNIADTPMNYWESVLAGSADGMFDPVGGASGTVTVMAVGGGSIETDPGTLIPMVDEAVELVLLPIAAQRYTGTPGFKNEAAKAEIARQYKTAKDKLSNSRVITKARDVAYF